MHHTVTTRRVRERHTDDSAEVEENTIPCKTVYTRIFISQLEVRYAEITLHLNIKPVGVGVLVYWN